MSNRMIQAVLFDFDLTLGRPVGDLSIAERQARLYASLDLPYDAAAIQAAMEQRRAAVASGRLPGVERPQRRRDLLTGYRQTLRLLGYQGDVVDMAQRLYHGYAALPFQPYDDARPLLTTLRARGLRLGIVSNHTPAARPMMETLFGDLIPASAITISGEVGVHKPRPSIFRRGAARVGVPPTRCAFVGDNLHVDAEAAVAAGYALGIWLDREGDAPAALPDRVRRVTALHDVLYSVCHSGKNRKAHQP
jgi:HAD superfamily hydrolase (TIGR01509 family)